MNIHVVILAGGSGTRFWPASRRSRPKQFLPLAQGKTLLQATVDRVQHFTSIEKTWIVTNAEQAAQFGEVLEGFPEAQVILEPEGRDTAPCVALCAAHIEARDPGAMMVVMPADHLILPEDELRRAVEAAVKVAADDQTLVTFGIRPTHPATGYGYIELGNALPESEEAFEVLQFREKPDLPTARTFMEGGQFLWNSGIFVWNHRSLTRAMEIADAGTTSINRDLLEACKRGDDEARDAAFRALPKTSVDYAVMEKADHVAVIRASFEWHDLGSFNALGAVQDADAWQNVILNLGPGLAITHQTENCKVYSDDGQNLVLFGVEDLVVVQSGGTTMICPAARADDLKELIQHLEDRGHNELR